MSSHLFSLILVGLVASSLAVEITDCTKPGTVGRLVKVEVTNCTAEDTTCTLKRGSKAMISVEFETAEEVMKLKHTVHGIIRNVPIPFKLPNEDACVDTGLTCPLAAGKHKYSYELFVKPVYPTVSHLEVKWQITDTTTQKDVVCVEIPAQVR